MRPEIITTSVALPRGGFARLPHLTAGDVGTAVALDRGQRVAAARAAIAQLQTKGSAMPDSILAPATLPMRPWDYVRRRRLLAGLTIAQAAREFHRYADGRPDYQRIVADVEANLRQFESPGVVMKPSIANETIRAFDFDPVIYRQLQDLPQFHPTICRCCGSTDMEPRLTYDGASACLDDEQICTACREDQQQDELRRHAA